ncbi:HAD family hydrolase [Flavobacterium saccharophilum]|uniref:Haloacid dehalogenase superfamily, subfamily IA, variant 3 with third motif having DD or ED n=1 Tax=Flavobacterium saccharophilum TaxID=29534 RepID=A0A1M7JJN3_9FLAO|nr:HAD-IA family hydrolase [Flavobacterium saccharophilum]SHM53176.1 haloacid dehalogenase superfamily, subfamily IA, variant 3 with third motif having DD or ED [Flavobacterium saccharophilum]
MENIKCVIFDCDGVLVDSETIGNKILVAMGEELGLKMSLQEAFLKFNGTSLKNCFQIIQDGIEQKLPDNFESEFRRRSFEAFKKEMKPVKGAKEFIHKLKIPFCVASSGPIEKVFLNLTTTGFIKQFENKMFSSYLINSWKPDPGIFLHAAKEMGFTVEECIVIEDSKAGVIAAKRGGFTVYGLANSHNEKELEKEGAIIFYSYEELARMLSL